MPVIHYIPEIWLVDNHRGETGTDSLAAAGPVMSGKANSSEGPISTMEKVITKKSTKQSKKHDNF